jgi:hemerythrin
MPFVAWEQKYLLGIEQFDVHHKYLVDLLNEIYQMFLSKEADAAELERVLAALSEYSKYHFDLEESWMMQVNYPKHKEHVVEHQKFVYKLFELNKQLATDKSQLTLEIIVFLRRWLLEHILTADAKYGAFIRKGGNE